MELHAIKQRFGIIGNDPGLERALDTAVRVAPTDLTVLITGESGVGKEVFSKIIHQLSPRKHNKFIPINCGAIPEGTINSELFGHEKGAFTGATSDRKGYFETVNGGTIFLDEIGEMPLDTQAYLLRVLESGEYIRVGASSVQKTDVRVLAATNVSLEDRVRKGKFREDLYYRLNTVPIKVPPLRERKQDIPMLFRRFALDFAEKYRADPIRLTEQAQTLVVNYRWPGNIRELRNIAEQMSVLSENRLLGPEHLLHFLPDAQRSNLPVVSGTDQHAGMEEREILYKLLFDMKSDLNDLKSLVFGLIRNNDLEMPDRQVLPALSAPAFEREKAYSGRTFMEENNDEQEHFEHRYHADQPIIINRNEATDMGAQDFGHSQEVEENLRLEDIEKETIRKALRKHKGRRKDAALELDISERTLYRKIKQYNL